MWSDSCLKKPTVPAKGWLNYKGPEWEVQRTIGRRRARAMNGEVMDWKEAGGGGGGEMQLIWDFSFMSKGKQGFPRWP